MLDAPARARRETSAASPRTAAAAARPSNAVASTSPPARSRRFRRPTAAARARRAPPAPAAPRPCSASLRHASRRVNPRRAAIALAAARSRLGKRHRRRHRLDVSGCLAQVVPRLALRLATRCYGQARVRCAGESMLDGEEARRKMSPLQQWSVGARTASRSAARAAAQRAVLPNRCATSGQRLCVRHRTPPDSADAVGRPPSMRSTAATARPSAANRRRRGDRCCALPAPGGATSSSADVAIRV